MRVNYTTNAIQPIIAARRSRRRRRNRPDRNAANNRESTNRNNQRKTIGKPQSTNARRSANRTTNLRRSVDSPPVSRELVCAASNIRRLLLNRKQPNARQETKKAAKRRETQCGLSYLSESPTPSRLALRGCRTDYRSRSVLSLKLSCKPGQRERKRRERSRQPERKRPGRKERKRRSRGERNEL